MKADVSTYIAALKACSTFSDLNTGTRIHAATILNGHGTNIAVANTLLHMYAKCESKFEAQRVFNSMMHHNVVSWNAIIFGYAEHGCSQLILQLFAQMQDEGFTPNARTYVAALKACASFAPEEKAKQVVQKLVKIECLEKGMAIHSQLAKGGYELNVFVANTLVDMYYKCGSMVHALLVFDRMLLPTVVSWSAVVFGFAESGENELALEIFACMQDEGFRPNDRTYVAVLKACANCATQEEGKQIEGKLVKIKFLEKGMAFHSQLAKETHEKDIFVSSTLVDMYAKCGAMLQAWQIFDRMTHPNIVSWNAMIFGYAESGESKLALLFFKYMQDYSLTPDTLTYLAMLLSLTASQLALPEDEMRRIERVNVRASVKDYFACP